MQEKKKQTFDDTDDNRGFNGDVLMEQNTLYVYAGVEGAGKTSISGVLNAFCADHLETTLAKKSDLGYICRANEQGYYVYMFYIGLNTLEEHLERIQNRVRKGGEGADPVEVERQFNSRWPALEAALPLCHEVRFFDSTEGMRCVATYRCDQVHLREEALHCKWFQEWYRWHQENIKKKEE